jgi:predicted amidohydrolase YtcJ
MELPRKWPVPIGQYVEGARNGQEQAFRLGVTAIDEMGRLETFEAFRRLEDEDLLRLRVRHFFPLERQAELADHEICAGLGSGRLRVAGLKGFLDGSIGARTAAIAHPYADRDTTGMLLWDVEALREAVREGAASGYTIALHAIGERAVRQALGVLCALQGPAVAGPHRIEHVEDVEDPLFVEARGTAVAFSMQPNFTARWQGEGGMYARALGDERRRRLNRFRSAAAGVPVLFGSDTMPFGPLEGILGAIDHPEARERLTLAQALRAYEAGGLAAGGGGPLAPGARADLIVVRATDPRAPFEDALRARSVEVVWTAAAGEPVWCAPEASAPASLRGPWR